MEMNTESELDRHVRRSIAGVARSTDELQERALELRAHLEDAFDSRASAGMDPVVALSEALRAFGTPERIRRSFVREDLRVLARESLHLPWLWIALMSLDLTLHTTWYTYFRSLLAQPAMDFWGYLFVATSICFVVYWLAVGAVQAGLRLRSEVSDEQARGLGNSLIALGVAVWALLPAGMAAMTVHDAVLALSSNFAWQAARTCILLALTMRCMWQLRALYLAR